MAFRHSDIEAWSEMELTQWRGVVFGEDLVFGPVRKEEQQMVQVADAIGQRADGEVFSCVRHKVPYHSFPCDKYTHRRFRTFWNSFEGPADKVICRFKPNMTFSRSKER